MPTPVEYLGKTFVTYGSHTVGVWVSTRQSYFQSPWAGRGGHGYYRAVTAAAVRTATLPDEYDQQDFASVPSGVSEMLCTRLDPDPTIVDRVRSLWQSNSAAEIAEDRYTVPPVADQIEAAVTPVLQELADLYERVDAEYDIDLSVTPADIKTQHLAHDDTVNNYVETVTANIDLS